MTQPGLKDVAFAATVTDLGQEGTIPCLDPSCAAQGGLMEPEQDGDHRYFACTSCGYEGGYTKMPTAVLAEGPDGSCSIGVPEDIRRAASAPMETAQAEQARSQPVPLGLTIGRRPEV